MWPTSTALPTTSLPAAVCRLRAGLAFVHAANVGGSVQVKSRPGTHVAQVIVELVGAGDQVLAAFERFVDDDGQAVAERLCIGLQDRPGRENPPGR